MPSALKVDQLGGANFGGYHLRNVASLHVGGSGLATAILDVSGSKTANAGSAIGQNNTTTLVAAANNDILTALRIAPTFTNGAFTGVVNKALWVVSGLTDLDGDLDVAGTTTIATLSSAATTITGVFTQNSSVTATSGAARSMVLTPTLTAAANNDTLTAVRIAPTFTPGAFTGVTSIALEVTAGRTTLQTLTTSGLITANAGVTLGATQRLTFGDATYLDTAPTGVDEAAAYTWTGQHIWSNTDPYVQDTTTAGRAEFSARNDGNFSLALIAHGSAYAGTLHGITLANSAWLYSNLAGPLVIGQNSAQPIILTTNALERFRVDSNGNFGINRPVTKSWNTSWAVMEGYYGAVMFPNGVSAGMQSTWNAYIDSTGTWKHIHGDQASMYYQLDGQHVFRVAAPGSPDTAVSWVDSIILSYDGYINTRQISPHTDNTFRLGQAALRWIDVYAVNGTIQTSARHFKDLKRTLTPEEGMEAVATLPVYEYTRKNDEDELRRFGPVLDEMPEYLRPNEDGETWVEGNLLAFNTLAIQNLNERVTVLEKLVA